MNLTERLAQERRGRLAAERLLELKSRELFEANHKLSLHALKLTDTLVVERAEAQELKGQNSKIQADLVRAEEAAGTAERRLWDSVETITDGFAIFDAQDRMIEANSAWMSIFAELELVKTGCTYLEILQLCTSEGLVDIGDESPSEWIAKMLGRWDRTHIPDYTLRLWNGRYLRLVDRRVRTGDMVCLALDITSTIRREEELREARMRAEAASRAKSAFLAKMSHELRTPMNGVVGMAELLLENEDNDEKRLFAETIRNSGEALLTIINDVLDFSKIEAGRLELIAEPFNLERIAYEVMLLGQSSLHDKELELVVDYDLFLPTSFVGDMGRVRQVLTNLVGNAIKFTSKGHVVLRMVGVDMGEDASRRRIHVTVEDTGIGIAKDQQAHVFGQFNQVEDEQNRKFEGTGLGLAITRQLVEAMGGTIWVDSDLGQGATFGFSLELEVAEQTSLPVLENAPSTALVVMHNGLSRQVMVQQLQQLQIQPTAAETGSGALELLRSGLRPQVMIIDGSLQDAEGHELAKAARQLGLTSPVLLTQQRRTVWGDAPGKDYVTAFLHRPASREDLIRALQELSGADQPTKAATPLAAPQAAAAPPQAAAAPVENRRMRVLAAEDNRTNQMVFKKILKDVDIDLTMVSNGREAVEAWKTLQPDLIFMDISMPELDGKEATRLIREQESLQGQGQRVPIVAMTAHAMQGDEQDILGAGLDHYLTKPLKKAMIFQQIQLHAPDGLDPVPLDFLVARTAQA